MTRDAGQIDGARLALGGLVTAGVLLAIVLACAALVDRGTDAAPPPVAIDCDTVPSGDVVDVSSPVLLACPELFDGRGVTFVGEVVGSIMQRGQRAWLQVNDDAYALVLGPLPVTRVAAGSSSSVAVSVSRAAVERVLFVGGADARGDRVRIFGVFHAADPSDAGNPTIRADRVDVVEPGARFDRPASTRRTVAAVVALTVAALTTALSVRARARS